MNTKEKGNIAELKIAAKLTELGHQVSIPFGENSSYDLVLERENGELKKVQCKYVSLRNGRLDVPLGSVYLAAGKYKHHRYVNLDFIGVYCPDLGKVYLIPHEDVASLHKVCRLRVDAAKGVGSSLIRWAKDYEI